ncbi:MAG: hypothetical protein HC916_12495 [Coleofasciculaceae cyanobacterium SM2_1_6]|nr:hypothetical protein [Coleofasciculaceae cyanobacterium SM2_1_6]
MTNGNPSAGSGTNNGSDRIDLLIDQMAVLTELVAQTSININRLGEKIDNGFARTMAAIEKSSAEQNNRFNQVMAAIEKSSAEQNGKIDRVMAAQSQTVDRLVGVVEQLLRDRQH